MTRKEKRTAKQKSANSTPAPIEFHAICTLGYEEVKAAFYNNAFKQMASDIMEISDNEQRAVGELQRLKHMWELLWDREDIEDLCEEELECNEDGLQELYDKVTLGLEHGQGTMLFNVMRMELLQMFLSFLLPDTPTACCLDACCDRWIETLQDSDEDDA